ncbi:beta-1,4-galactosyltransferase 7-like, partial [Homarus americanus]|uniref:beta-1,4-galactosyltransferase 7-like n=1 Tax=Homarus americanus TaxID=6706 RepID=UPI001C451950
VTRDLHSPYRRSRSPEDWEDFKIGAPLQLRSVVGFVRRTGYRLTGDSFLMDRLLPHWISARVRVEGSISPLFKKMNLGTPQGTPWTANETKYLGVYVTPAHAVDPLKSPIFGDICHRASRPLYHVQALGATIPVISPYHFRTVNGFSNKFWGWGGEDDDMSNRLLHHGFFISRSPRETGRFTMLTHTKEKPSAERLHFLHDGSKRFNTDGINSIKYQVLDIQRRRLYTWIYV